MTNWRLWFRVAWAALSERSNQAFYDEIAPIYDQVFVSHRVHAETILDLLQEVSVDRDEAALVLDLGCGTGLLSTLLADQGIQVIGLDISFRSLCILRQHQQRIRVVQADANGLPFANKAFRRVVCLGVCRHFSELQQIIMEVCRVLSDDGVFIVGYFPPALGGAVAQRQTQCSQVLRCLYQQITQKLGYVDRVDSALIGDTERLSGRHFKTVARVNSGNGQFLLMASHPLS
jgi:ubiquinone/menaquinone biosynthesis C-methylase UbiE